jgi:hypothetical protein
MNSLNKQKRKLKKNKNGTYISGQQVTIEEVCATAAQWPKIAQSCGVPHTMISSIESNMLLSL